MSALDFREPTPAGDVVVSCTPAGLQLTVPAGKGRRGAPAPTALEPGQARRVATALLLGARSVEANR